MLGILLKNKYFYFVLLGIILRFGIMVITVPNYDFQSYLIVGEIASRFGKVYTETSRYNYAPVWFLILGLVSFLSQFSSNYELVFRSIIVGILTIVDIGIFYLIYKNYSKNLAILFFLNPLTILLTGFHHQFDNFAILFALISIIYLEKSKDKNRVLFAAAFLGLSLCIKHLFFVFPIWLFFKQEKHKDKFIILVIPYIIFFASFFPFIDQFTAIKENVFLYRSVMNFPLLGNFGISGGFLNLVYFSFYLATLIIFGLVLKKKKNFETFLLYTLVLVIFSPSIILNYLAITVIAVMYFRNFFFLIFNLLCVWLYLLDKLGANWKSLIEISPHQLLYSHYGNSIYQIPILFLFLGFVLILLQNNKMLDDIDG